MGKTKLNKNAEKESKNKGGWKKQQKTIRKGNKKIFIQIYRKGTHLKLKYANRRIAI